MTAKEIENLEKSLTQQNPFYNILIKKQGYYFYLNTPNIKTKTLKIHKHSCGNCAYGTGKIDGINGSTGLWMGPFEDIKYLHTFVEDYFSEYKSLLDYCGCIKENLNKL